jgi:Leucine-rich repeat (LRR) protein
MDLLSISFISLFPDSPPLSPFPSPSLLSRLFSRASYTRAIAKMAPHPFLVHLLLTLLFLSCDSALLTPEVSSLMALKASLDPPGHVLSTWTRNGDPCSGTFEGVACNIHRKVTSISLQGMGLSGSLSPAIAGLRWLTGLYLHYNKLTGEIPREVGNLTMLYDLYLDVNRLTGRIPVEIGNMGNLQGELF